MQGIGKIDPLPTVLQRGFHFVVIFYSNPRQRDQVREASMHFVDRLFRYRSKHPFEFQ